MGRAELKLYHKTEEEYLVSILVISYDTLNTCQTLLLTYMTPLSKANYLDMTETTSMGLHGSGKRCKEGKKGEKSSEKLL